MSVKNISVGRRKSSVARVRFVKGKGKIFINDRDPLEYFKRWIFYRLFSPSQSTSVRIGDEGYVTFSVDDIKGGRKFLEEICAFVESKRMQCEDNQFDQNDKYIIPIEEVIKYHC